MDTEPPPEKQPKSRTVHQIELMFVLKRQLDLVYKQLNHFRGAMKNVDKLNRYMRGVLDCNNNNNNSEEIQCDTEKNATDKDGGEQFDHRKLQNEFSKFDRNYRYWRKRLRKLDRKLLNVNLYDKLYDLYENLVIGDCEPISFEELLDFKDIVSAEAAAAADVSAEIDVAPTSSSHNNNNNNKDIEVVTIDSDSDTDTGDEIFITEDDIEVKLSELNTPEQETLKLSVVDNFSQLPLFDVNDVPQQLQQGTSKIVHKFIHFSPTNNIGQQSVTSKHNNRSINPIVIRPFEIKTGQIAPISLHNMITNISADRRPQVNNDSNLKFDKVSNPNNYSRAKTEVKKKKKLKQKVKKKRVRVKKAPTQSASSLSFEYRPFRCDIAGCTFSAKTSANLKSHQVSHSNKRPYKCQHPGCNFAAKLNNVLTRHKQVHSNRKPYLCKLCQKLFKNFSIYRQHWSDVHGNSKGKGPINAFSCEIDGCEQSFADNSRLSKHIAAVHAKNAPRLNIGDFEIFHDSNSIIIE